MSGNCELRRGLRRRQKNATEAGAGRFEKPAPDARAAPPKAHELLIGRKTVAVVSLTGLSLGEWVGVEGVMGVNLNRRPIMEPLNTGRPRTLTTASTAAVPSSCAPPAVPQAAPVSGPDEA